MAKLNTKSIFFAHQSVGYNILEGLQDLMAEDGRLKLRTLETKSVFPKAGGLLAHCRIGRNRNPALKLEEFSRVLGAGVGDCVDFAMLKFCYIDFGAKTDVEALFASYKGTLDVLKRNHSSTTFVHTTTPLVVRQAGLKSWIKGVLDRPVGGVEDNVVRQRFNELVRQEYRDKEPVFDLAAVESTYPDGRRESFVKNGVRSYALVPHYTNDGGHLDAVGRKVVAARWIEFLAGLGEP